MNTACEFRAKSISCGARAPVLKAAAPRLSRSVRTQYSLRLLHVAWRKLSNPRAMTACATGGGAGARHAEMYQKTLAQGLARMCASILIVTYVLRRATTRLLFARAEGAHLQKDSRISSAGRQRAPHSPTPSAASTWRKHGGDPVEMYINECSLVPSTGGSGHRGSGRTSGRTATGLQPSAGSSRGTLFRWVRSSSRQQKITPQSVGR